MRRVVILLMCICIWLNAHAQVPGYMGKKFAVGYHIDITPMFQYGFFMPPDVSYKGKTENNGLWMYTRHNIDVEWVAGKKISLQGSIGFSRNGLFTYDTEDEGAMNDYPKISRNYNYYQNERSYDYVRGRNTLFKLGVNVFSKNYIAPHGNYWNFSMLMNRSHIEYIVKGEAKDLTLIKSYGFLISKGYRKIIKDAVIIDVGFGTGWMFGSRNRGGIISSNLRVQNPALLLHWHLGVKYLIGK